MKKHIELSMDKRGNRAVILDYIDFEALAFDDSFKRLLEPSISNEVIKEAKEKADILYRLAWLQHQTGFSEESKRSLESCLKYNPYHQDAKIMQIRVPKIK